MIKYKKINQEVIYAQDPIVKLDFECLEFLKDLAANNERKRARLCLHEGIESNVHEMIIVHAKGAYIRPHKHLNKSESFHVIEGRAKVIMFEENGIIREIIPIGGIQDKASFFYRISQPVFHSLDIVSDYIIFHETTKGPLHRDETVFASWAPDEKDLPAGLEFMRNIRENIQNR